MQRLFTDMMKVRRVRCADHYTSRPIRYPMGSVNAWSMRGMQDICRHGFLFSFLKVLRLKSQMSRVIFLGRRYNIAVESLPFGKGPYCFKSGAVASFLQPKHEKAFNRRVQATYVVLPPATSTWPAFLRPLDFYLKGYESRWEPVCLCVS